jgi:tRNA(Ser,Leu) C12 N-acetylase TAN1
MSTAIENAREIIGKIRAGNLDELAALPTVLNALEIEIDVQASLDEIQDRIGALKNTIDKVDLDLRQRVTAVEDSLRKQTDQLFLSDEEHKQMVKHVHTVLDQLEDYLRRHT